MSLWAQVSSSPSALMRTADQWWLSGRPPFVSEGVQEGEAQGWGVPPGPHLVLVFLFAE